MRLSFIFELLLLFVLIAFAASRVIDESKIHGRAASVLRRPHHHNSKLAAQKVRQEASSAANKYCSCNTKLCNCCREFQIPVVALQGPGCASLQYLRGDKLAISMSFGDRILTNTTIDSRKPKPVCMPLPGGVSKFCGRVYNIARQGEDFNACLGLELRAVKDVEAALRVSCFKFGPKGLKLSESQPLPPVEQFSNNNEDDDDDDDDDEDEYDFDDVDDIDDIDDDDDDDDEEDDDNAVDYGTFSVFDDDFIGTLFTSEGGTGTPNKKRKVASTTKAPLRRTPTKRTVVRRKPVAATSTTSPIAVTKKVPQPQAQPTPTTLSPAVVVQNLTQQTTTEKLTPPRRTTVVVRRKIKPTKAVPSTTLKASTTVKEETTQDVSKLTASSTTEPTKRLTSTGVPSTTKQYITKKVTVPSTTATTTTTSTTTTTPEPELEPEVTTQSVTTTESVGLITSATIVTSEKKPVVDDLALPEKTIASNEVIATPHESIAAVAAMLQNIPGETPGSQEVEASKVVSGLGPSTEKVNWVTFHYEPVKLETTTERNDVVNEVAYEVVNLGNGVTNPEVESTTVTDVTEEITTPGITDEDDDEEDTVTLQNFIIKNDDSNDNEDETTTAESEVTQTEVPTTESVVTEVALPSAKVEKLIKPKDKPESKDVFTDIIDGVVSTFGGGDSEEEKDKKPADDDKDDDDDDDDDDDFLGDDDDDDDDDDDEKDDDDKEDDDEKETEKDKLEDEEDDDDDDDDEPEKDEAEKETHIEHDDEDEDDDDDDEDFAGRKAKQHQKVQLQLGLKHPVVRGRQSRDMWLDRLHW